jgi:formylglycine-generating enzyme required for sulfatase activity
MYAGHINTDENDNPSRVPASRASQTNMVFVKGGNFDMGELFSFDSPRVDEEPVHEVYVDDFYIGKYEVTQGLWEEVMGNNPSYFKDYGNIYPVESVSWIDVQEFLKKLNQKTELNYRLPTEAEWEYAARGGGEGFSYSGTNSKTKLGSYAWYDVSSRLTPINANACGETHSVGQKKPNGLGLYDMSGNVWEWCSDWYDAKYYGKSPKNNPQGPPGGSLRICRGGSWDLTAMYLLNIRRGSKRPNSVSHDLGFRLARTL